MTSSIYISKLTYQIWNNNFFNLRKNDTKILKFQLFFEENVIFCVIRSCFDLNENIYWE